MASKKSWFHVQRFFRAPQKWNPESVVLITGASSGIGEHLAYAYSTRSCKLALLGRNTERLERVAQLCVRIAKRNKHFPRVMTIAADVTDEKQCKAAVDKVLDEWSRLDLLVLNAGIGAHHVFDDETDMNIFRRLMETNFYGYVNFMKHAYDEMCRNHGQVVVVNSISGEMGFAYRTAYCASKHAVTGFFEALRAEILQDQSELGARKKYKFDITIVCPPSVTGTSLRENSLQRLDLNSSSDESKGDSVNAEECAGFIVEAADRHIRKVFFPLKAYIGVYVRPFLPDVIDNLARKVSGVIKTPKSAL